MKKETNTRCYAKVPSKPYGRCDGAFFLDLSISKLEEYLEHRLYKCDECGAKYKVIPNKEL